MRTSSSGVVPGNMQKGPRCGQIYRSGYLGGLHRQGYSGTNPCDSALNVGFVIGEYPDHAAIIQPVRGNHARTWSGALKSERCCKAGEFSGVSVRVSLKGQVPVSFTPWGVGGAWGQEPVELKGKA